MIISSIVGQSTFHEFAVLYILMAMVSSCVIHELPNMLQVQKFAQSEIKGL